MLNATKRLAVAEELALTDKQRMFARFLAEGKTPETAHALCGYKRRSSHAWETLKVPGIMEYVKKLQKKNEHMMDMSRKRVMDGFLEAIEQAKLMSEPMTQIAGWREIAKMCGYYAPEVKKIDINVSSQRILSQLETLSDADLLEMIETDAETIEGEARELLVGPDTVGDSIEELDRSAGEEAEAGDSRGGPAPADGRNEEDGAGESGAGEEEPDPVREKALPELQSGMGA